MKTVLGLFGKQPIPGKVKSRLAADIGPEVAAELYAAFLTDLVDRFAQTGHRRIIGYSPATAASTRYFETLSASRYELWAQPDASLGERMERFFTEMLPPKHATEPRETAVVLIGSDSPTLPVPHVAEAFDALQTSDCVLGPATDGGYYLIGLKRFSPGLLEGIEWSAASVLEQTVRNLAARDFRLHLLSPWYDVDTLDDLHALCGHLTAMDAAGHRELPERTMNCARTFRDALWAES